MVIYEPCTELLSHDQPGGYHPVHLGDTFHDDTYEVVGQGQKTRGDTQA